MALSAKLGGALCIDERGESAGVAPREQAATEGGERVPDDFVRDAGYNRWAGADRIVVLYPQATVATGNPRACWDFWGYSGDDGEPAAGSRCAPSAR